MHSAVRLVSLCRIILLCILERFLHLKRVVLFQQLNLSMVYSDAVRVNGSDPLTTRYDWRTVSRKAILR